MLQEAPRGSECYPAVMHAAVPDEGRVLAAELAAALDLPEIPMLDVPPAIATHAGPGALGVSFFAI